MITSRRREVWTHTTSLKTLILTLFIEVPVPNQSERSCICVLGVLVLPFLRFLLYFWIFTTVWYFRFSFYHLCRLNDVERSSWSWSYGGWINNYLCNKCMSPLTLWVQIPLRRGVLYITLCDKVCHWLVTGRWFSLDTPVSSTNKTHHHDIAEILLKVAVSTIKHRIGRFVGISKSH